MVHYKQPRVLNGADLRKTTQGSFQTALEASTIVVLDGAFGTELQRRGVDVHHDLWSGRAVRDEPQAVQQLHESYIKAGADIISTASYQIGLQGPLLTRAVELAMAAREQLKASVFVAGTLGPYGAVLADGSEYTGDYTVQRQRLTEFHMERAYQLVENQVDVIAFETLPSLAEVEAVVDVIQRFHPHPAWLSLSCRDAYSLASGEPIREVFDRVRGIANLVAFGVNCSQPSRTEQALRTLAQDAQCALIAYPNGGGHWDPVARRWHGASQTPDWEHWVSRFVEAGARIVGGCCHTTPQDIAQIRKWVDGLG